MSALNLVLLNGHIYCRECLVQIPDTFLACPICYGLVREWGHWVAPAPTPTAKSSMEDEEQPLLFNTSAPEYPA